jgi:hypothetical protein
MVLVASVDFLLLGFQSKDFPIYDHGLIRKGVVVRYDGMKGDEKRT